MTQIFWSSIQVIDINLLPTIQIFSCSQYGFCATFTAISSLTRLSISKKWILMICSSCKTLYHTCILNHTHVIIWFPDFSSPVVGISRSLLTGGKPVDQKVELRSAKKQIQLVSAGKGCRILASFETLPLSPLISTCFHRVACVAARCKKGRGRERGRISLPYSLPPNSLPLPIWTFQCMLSQGRLWVQYTFNVHYTEEPPLIQSTMGQKHLAVLMSDCIKVSFFYKKMYGLYCSMAQKKWP